MSAIVEFCSPVKVIVGKGAMENIATELAFCDSHKPLIVARSGEQDNWTLRALIDAFRETGVNIGVFAGVSANPSIETIKDIYDIYSKRGFDSLIAFGGKEVLHTVKLANIASSLCPDTLRSFLNSASPSIPHNERLKPLVAIPNLVADGYEFSKYAIFAGKCYKSPAFIPNLMVVDKYALDGVFEHQAAHSAAIAMVHALDSYTSQKASSFSDAYATALIALLVTGVVNAGDLRIGKIGKWKQPFVNALALAGCLLSNSEGDVGYGLALALSRATNVPLEECAAAMLASLAQQAVEKRGVEIGEMLMPMLAVNSPQEATAALLSAASRITALAKPNWEGMLMSGNEQTAIAERIAASTGSRGCFGILQRLSKDIAQRRAGR